MARIMVGKQVTGPLRSHEVDAVALLSEPTRRLLYERVCASQGLSRDAAAAATGISRDLAAFHLDRLVEAGLLSVTHRRLSGRTGPGAGRPAKVYTRSDREFNVALPERRYDLLAQTLVEGVEALADDLGQARVAAALDDTARRHGREAGRSVRRAAGSRAGAKRRVDKLVGVLEASGFEPRVSEDGAQITLANCPYQAIAKEHRALTCGMNLAWAQGVLEQAGETGLEPRLDIEPGRCCVVFALD
jgi:predicted ArsR family transcriptional regulator